MIADTCYGSKYAHYFSICYLFKSCLGEGRKPMEDDVHFQITMQGKTWT